MGLTNAQVAQLLKPINERRVVKDGNTKSHVSQQDVRAHLIRVFGFGNFDVAVDGPHLVFEQERLNENNRPTGRWDVCYRATVTLTIRDPKGAVVCVYQGSATDTAENQKRGAAHGLALRSAESVALKRASTNLGDQFGLSLYNKGQTKALVGGTLVLPGGPGSFKAGDRDDLQEHVPEQVSLGRDEGGEDVPVELPTNKDGSLSRSQLDDEQLAAAGSMTRAEVKAHNKLVKEVLDTGGQAADRDDAWTQGPPPPDELAKFRNDKLTRPQQTKLLASFERVGWPDRDDRLRACSTLVGRAVESSSDLTREEAKAVLDVLDILARAADPAGLFTDYLAAARAVDTEEMKRVLTFAATEGRKAAE